MKGGVKVFFRGEKWDHNVYWNLEVWKLGSHGSSLSSVARM